MSDSLLDRLAVIDAKIMEGLATREEIEEGQRLVRLANAAPTLLALLKRSRSIISISYDDRDEAAEGKLFDDIEEAIAKAEGEGAAHDEKD